jgi:hypothetical protein
MHVIPPEGPLHRDDRDAEPAWLEEPSTTSRIDHDGKRRSSVIATLLLVAAVALVVALILIL